MRSVMKHQFSQVPRAEIERSTFDRSHGYKTTMMAGDLVPFYVDEALPGDTHHMRVSIFMRLATPLHPFMDNMFVDVFFFAVPIRLIWSNWQKFNGEQDNPGDSTSYLIPTMTAPAGGYAIGSLHDYFGLPTGKAGVVHSSLWHRAYNLIFKEWFRDQNMQNSPTIDKGDGPDTSTNYVVLKRGKRHDYFTSCLPFPQKGPAVSLPLGTSAAVRTSATQQVSGVQQPMLMAVATTGANVGTSQNGLQFNNSSIGAGSTNVGANSIAGSYPNNLYADLTTATASTINALRNAFQIQRLYERDARGGTRYTEIIRAHFGVDSPDARLQRPEYLGGGSIPLNVNPIAQTSSAASQPTPQGNLAAMGTAHGSGIGFVKSFTEHCVLIGLVSARADLNYQQGLNRMFSRSTRWDFFWPALAHIGEQPVLNKEIYAQGTAGGAADDGIFGYQERYAEYRYKPSVVTGQFRSSAAQPLDTWHLAQNFTSLPVLNSTFIQEQPPVARVIAVPTEPHFLFDAYCSLKSDRPMPVFGVPGLIDHF